MKLKLNRKLKDTFDSIESYTIHCTVIFCKPCCKNTLFTDYEAIPVLTMQI